MGSVQGTVTNYVSLIEGGHVKPGLTVHASKFELQSSGLTRDSLVTDNTCNQCSAPKFSLLETVVANETTFI